VTVDGLLDRTAPDDRDAAGHAGRSSPGRLAQAHPAAGPAPAPGDGAGEVDTGSQGHRGDITVEAQPEGRATVGAWLSYSHPPLAPVVLSSPPDMPLGGGGAGPGAVTTGCGSGRRLA
jgi:hypothetical protein